MSATEQTRVLFASVPAGLPVPGTDIVVTKSAVDITGSSLENGGFLLRNLYLRWVWKSGKVRPRRRTRLPEETPRFSRVYLLLPPTARLLVRGVRYVCVLIFRVPSRKPRPLHAREDAGAVR
ncbi:MAG: hypothetical protein BJ554DRAFT_4536 [Olpidium bornovanus]|uniref:Uncharacterized protein n=1 Tax=Olpidium bornovanus TaxID=278681 RepID=A0A8H8DF09_9FUNG|nr:MAG: hypothetical protein BJ554DRAFT_4536 [Olpidium bornovanus]